MQLRMGYLPFLWQKPTEAPAFGGRAYSNSAPALIGRVVLMQMMGIPNLSYSVRVGSTTLGSRGVPLGSLMNFVSLPVPKGAHAMDACIAGAGVVMMEGGTNP